MASRDEWFTIHTSGDGSSSSVGSGQVAGGFQIDPEHIPAVRAAFEAALQEMVMARQVMRSMWYLGGESVNPVVDKYVAAVAEVGYGDQGSVTMAVDSAAAEYRNVILQLDTIMAGYANREEEIADRLGRLRS